MKKALAILLTILMAIRTHFRTHFYFRPPKYSIFKRKKHK